MMMVKLVGLLRICNHYYLDVINGKEGLAALVETWQQKSMRKIVNIRIDD